MDEELEFEIFEEYNDFNEESDSLNKGYHCFDDEDDDDEEELSDAERFFIYEELEKMFED